MSSFRINIAPKTKQTVAHLNIFSPNHNNEPQLISKPSTAYHSLSVVAAKAKSTVIDHSKLSRTANHSPHFKFLNSNPMRYKSQLQHFPEQNTPIRVIK